MLKGYYRGELVVGRDTWLGQGVFLLSAGASSSASASAWVLREDAHVRA
ncbi:MAG: hypothetical protein R3F43_32885 [bacterium]